MRCSSYVPLHTIHNVQIVAFDFTFGVGRQLSFKWADSDIDSVLSRENRALNPQWLESGETILV